MTEKYDTEALAELVKFLSPQTRMDVRREALDCVMSYSGAESACDFFMSNGYAVGKAICSLCENSPPDVSQTLSILTNFSSESAEVANFILTQSRCLQIAYDACQSHADFANIAARLLANLSRYFPDKVNDILIKHDANAVGVLVDLFCSSSEDSFTLFIGYTLVNLSSLCSIRYQLSDYKWLSKICVLITVEEKMEVAADILRNLAFEDALHPTLLDESDTYLASLLQPLADCSDNLSDDEIEKLPLRLQYYEGTRVKSLQMRKKLIEALYQLCATRHSREHLRKRGVYGLMRELDRATENIDQNIHSSRMNGVKLLTASQHNTLHALIGILIRDEDDINDSCSESLRSLN